MTRCAPSCPPRRSFVASDARRRGQLCTCSTRPDSTYLSGKSVQINRATSPGEIGQPGDRGSEFMAVDLREWLATHCIQPAYMDADKPWQHGSSESFNGTRAEVASIAMNFTASRMRRFGWSTGRQIYNEVCPQSRLGYWPPASAYFLERFQARHQAA